MKKRIVLQANTKFLGSQRRVRKVKKVLVLGLMGVLVQMFIQKFSGRNETGHEKCNEQNCILL